MKFYFDGEEVALSKFTKLCQKNLFYEQYMELWEKSEYSDDCHSFIIELENGKWRYEIVVPFFDTYDVEAEVLADSSAEAKAMFLREHPDYERANEIQALKKGVVPEYRFLGYRDEYEMYDDYYPSRPIEL